MVTAWQSGTPLDPEPKSRPTRPTSQFVQRCCRMREPLALQRLRKLQRSKSVTGVMAVARKFRPAKYGLPVPVAGFGSARQCAGVRSAALRHSDSLSCRRSPSGTTLGIRSENWALIARFYSHVSNGRSKPETTQLPTEV